MITPGTHNTEHLTCPRCEYDLYALPLDGQIVRCPECGNQYDLRLLRMPPDERERKIRGMESLPAFCGVCASFSVLCAYLLVAGWVRRRAAPGSGTPSLEVLAWSSVLCLVGWAAGLRVYLSRYRYVVGAVRALLLCHASAPLLLAATVVLIGASPALPFALNSVAATTAAFVLGGAGAWLYIRARAILARMYDQLAGPGEGKRP